jgi:hypothetical protein
MVNIFSNALTGTGKMLPLIKVNVIKHDEHKKT